MCLLAACSGSKTDSTTTVSDSPPEISARPPNIVIILFDTLRADCTGPYNPQETNTPAMTRLAAEGTLFRHAYAPSSYTKTSVATFMTATHPWVHGCLTKENSLPDNLPYLPESLQQAGYHTVGVIGNPHVSTHFGFGRGYDVYTLMPVGSTDRQTSRQKSPAALVDWVWDGHVAPALTDGEDAPLFLYLHEVDPHGPYEPPAPYDALYSAGDTSSMPSNAETLHGINLGEIAVIDADIQHFKRQYRGEIAYMDGFLDHFIARIESEIPGDTIIVFISDHGEEFYERGHVQHWMTLNEESVRVPLIMRFPRDQHQGTTEADVGLVDLMPTLLEACGLPSPSGMNGRSLLPLLKDPATPRWPVFGQVLPYIEPDPMTYSVVLDRWKLIVAESADGPVRELFDLTADPGERMNLWQENSEKGIILQKFLDETRSLSLSDNAQSVGSIPAEIEQGLRSLGYIE